ncbi:MAG: LptF/LptG family permease [Candidatus Acetothermia bacterium]
MKRYVSRQVVALFLIALFGLILFTSLTLAVQLSDLILDRSESFLTVFKLLSLKIPEFMGFALPISLVVSTFIVLARMMNNGEILAFQLGGYSLKHLAFPILLIGLGVSLAAFGMNNYLVPWSNYQYRKEIYRITTESPLPSVQSDVFFKDPSGRTIYVGRYLEEEGMIEDVLIFNSAGLDLPGLELDDNYPELLSSKSGRLTEEGWKLESGQLIGLNEGGEVDYTMGFEELEVDIAAAVEDLVFSSRKTEEMGLVELWNRARTAEKAGRSTTQFRFALHSRFSQPLAGLVFVLFSAPLSLILRHRSRAVGILLALLSVGGYQGVLLWGQTVVRQNALQPYLGAWLPDMIFGGVGLLLFLALDRTGGFAFLTRPFKRIDPWS